MSARDEILEKTTIACAAFAQRIERKLNTCLKPLPAGIWLPNVFQPIVIGKNTHYVYTSDDMQTRHIDSLEPILSPVYNSTTGDCVISKGHISRKALRTQPYLPVRGLKIIKDYIDMYFSQRLAGVPTISEDYFVQKHFTFDQDTFPEYWKAIWESSSPQGDIESYSNWASKEYNKFCKDMVIMSSLEEILLDVTNMLDTFIGKYIWHHHGCYHRGSFIIITRGPDSRVIDCQY